jgi:hypothetical protein
MKVSFAQKGTLKAFTTPNCDAWVIEDATDFNAFLKFFEEQSAQVGTDFCLLSSFDNYEQACYTSGHAMNAYELDPPYEDEEPDLTCDEKFDVTLEAFLSQTQEIVFDELSGKLEGYNCARGTGFLAAINSDPSRCLDRKMVMQIVPVQKAEDSLAAFPNGYFTDDLSPFDIHALAKRLRDMHDYKLIAIGAQFMCYYRQDAATEVGATQLLRDIASLFDGVVGEWLASTLVQTLRGKHHLILPYTPFDGG